jgi:hypothetical protein
MFGYGIDTPSKAKKHNEDNQTSTGLENFFYIFYSFSRTHVLACFQQLETVWKLHNIFSKIGAKLKP